MDYKKPSRDTPVEATTSKQRRLESMFPPHFNKFDILHSDIPAFETTGEAFN